MAKFLLAAAAFVLSLSCLASAQEIVVGTNAGFRPFEFTDDNDNIVGFDIDVINAVAKAAGLTATIQHQPFDTLVEGLGSDRLDVVISGMTITDERREKVDFTEPYYNSAQAIVVADGTPGFTKIEDVAGKRIGVQIATTGAYMAEEVMGTENPDLKQLRDYNMVFTDLKLGRLDAIVVDLPVAQAYVKNIPGLKISSPPMSEEQYGIVVKKGNKELLDKLNAGLASIRASGEFDKIMAKWFE